SMSPHHTVNYKILCHQNHRQCFFFSSRRRHTRSDRDWSSDVCSSDLVEDPVDPLDPQFAEMRKNRPGAEVDEQRVRSVPDQINKIGRASCRERVEISVGAVCVKLNEL